mmetsp:Transcript_51570/g.122675  ORF Transcript_51570/g.122675 Transcript_51570/m.122675 type:complete len:234 (-) Transcript_51570:1469-2170(-)
MMATAAPEKRRSLTITASERDPWDNAKTRATSTCPTAGGRCCTGEGADHASLTSANSSAFSRQSQHSLASPGEGSARHSSGCADCSRTVTLPALASRLNGTTAYSRPGTSPTLQVTEGAMPPTATHLGFALRAASMPLPTSSTAKPMSLSTRPTAGFRRRAPRGSGWMSETQQGTSAPSLGFSSCTSCPPPLRVHLGLFVRNRSPHPLIPGEPGANSPTKLLLWYFKPPVTDA